MKGPGLVGTTLAVELEAVELELAVLRFSWASGDGDPVSSTPESATKEFRSIGEFHSVWVEVTFSFKTPFTTFGWMV